MSGNRAVAYKEPGVVEIIDTEYPTFELKDGPGVNPANVGRKVPHGVILRTVTTNICGSDQHMVRGRTTAPKNLVLGHEITGEVVEVGPDVEFIKVGDIVSVATTPTFRWAAYGWIRSCHPTSGMSTSATPPWGMRGSRSMLQAPTPRSAASPRASLSIADNAPGCPNWLSSRNCGCRTRCIAPVMRRTGAMHPPSLRRQAL